MPPALSVVPSDTKPDVLALSPARAALRDHLAVVAKASAARAEARAPLERTKAALAEANARLAAALADLDAVRQREAEDVGAWIDADVQGRPKPPPRVAERAEANAVIELARDEVGALEKALSSRASAVEQANAECVPLAAAIDELVLAVLTEEVDTAFQIREARRIEFIEADAIVIGLRSGLGARGRTLWDTDPVAGRTWLAAAGQIGEVWSTAERPETPDAFVEISMRKWEDFANRLLADPTAEFQP